MSFRMKKRIEPVESFAIEEPVELVENLAERRLVIHEASRGKLDGCADGARLTRVEELVDAA